MIQANELRIGNWVECDTTDGKLRYAVFEVWNDSALCISTVYESGAFKCAELFGIPLTEEILIAIGCEAGRASDEFLIDIVNIQGLRTFMLVQTDGCFILHERLKGELSTYYYHWLKEINYFHELQNIVYFLTGQELQFS